MNSPARSAFAVLTPPGRGGIAVIRCVGPAAVCAIETCFLPARPSHGKPPHPPPLSREGRGESVPSPLIGEGGRRPGLRPPQGFGPQAGEGELPEIGALAYGHIVDAAGQPLDEVILCRAAGETFEINCHGGPAAVRAILERLAALGLEKVDPDTLLEREGVPRIERDARLMLRAARTPLAARVLLDQLHGTLGRALDAVASHLEAGRAAEAVAGIDRLLELWRRCGRLLAAPPRVALAGRPNAGKSTLLNRLVGTDRAITSEVPGTTRDYVEAEASLEGVPVILVDTAGLREAAGGVEREAVERARREAARADLVVYLVDAVVGATVEDDEMIASLGRKGVVVWNKADAVGVPDGVAPVSALRGDGVAALVAAILERLGWSAPAQGEAVPFTRDQAAALEAARQAAVAGRTQEALLAIQSWLAV